MLRSATTQLRSKLHHPIPPMLRTPTTQIQSMLLMKTPTQLQSKICHPNPMLRTTSTLLLRSKLHHPTILQTTASTQLVQSFKPHHQIQIHGIATLPKSSRATTNGKTITRPPRSVTSAQKHALKKEQEVSGAAETATPHPVQPTTPSASISPGKEADVVATGGASGGSASSGGGDGQRVPGYTIGIVLLEVMNVVGHLLVAFTEPMKDISFIDIFIDFLTNLFDFLTNLFAPWNW